MTFVDAIASVAGMLYMDGTEITKAAEGTVNKAQAQVEYRVWSDNYVQRLPGKRDGRIDVRAFLDDASKGAMFSEADDGAVHYFAMYPDRGDTSTWWYCRGYFSDWNITGSAADDMWVITATLPQAGGGISGSA